MVVKSATCVFRWPVETANALISPFTSVIRAMNAPRTSTGDSRPVLILLTSDEADNALMSEPLVIQTSCHAECLGRYRIDKQEGTTLENDLTRPQSRPSRA